MLGKIVGSAVAVLLAAGLSAGCIAVDYGVELERDLSGTMDFSVALDADQMAYAMASMQKGFQGQEGEPTPEEIEAARKEVMAELESEREDFDLADIRRETREDLPEGVELVDATQSDDGLRTDLTFRFDHIRRLAEMEFTAEGDTADAGGAPTVQPFGGLSFTETGETFVLENTPMDPLADAGSEDSPLEAEMAQMKMMLRAMGGNASGPMVTFSMTAPFEVVEHNATRVEGNTLTWEYGLESFMSGDSPRSIRVEYRKP